MPRGLPDDSNIVKDSPTWNLSDQAELAARLGSIVTFDRMGTVVDLETFRQGMSRWQTNVLGIGAQVCLANYRSLVDGVSLLLDSGTGGAPVASAYWYHAYPELSRMGFEASYATEPDGNLLYHGFRSYHGGVQISPVVRWNLATGAIDYLNDANVWTATGITYARPNFDMLFHRIKIVCDIETAEYDRIVFDNYSVSMSGLYAFQQGAAPVSYMETWSEVRGDGVNEMLVHMDACIMTQSEANTP